jgi:hypothetical protein
MDGNGAQKAKEDKPPQAKDVTKNNPPGTKGVKGKPIQKIRYKKINPRKKAEKQTRTIVVAVPTKSEEIKDAGTTAKKKKRKTKGAPEDRLLGSTQGECSGPWEGSMRGS